MLKPEKIQSYLEARLCAEKYVRQGVGLLAHALNAYDNEETLYRYGDLEQERLKNIVIELIDIVERGKVELLARKRAKQDIKFQSIMKVITQE